MATIKLDRETMFEKMDREFRVRDEITDTTRWSTHHELIFKHDGKLYSATYSRGATEQQDERPWDGEDEIECTEVEAYEKTVTDYRAVP